MTPEQQAKVREKKNIQARRRAARRRAPDLADVVHFYLFGYSVEKIAKRTGLLPVRVTVLLQEAGYRARG